MSHNNRAFLARASRSAAAALALASSSAIRFLAESCSAASSFRRDAASVLAACTAASDNHDAMTMLQSEDSDFEEETTHDSFTAL